MKATVTYDPQRDVLRARLEGAAIHASREHPLDGNVIMNLDHDRRIVGVQLLYVSQLAGMWDVHPVRHSLPAELRSEITRFMGWFDAGSPDPNENARRHVPPQWIVSSLPS